MSIFSTILDKILPHKSEAVSNVIPTLLRPLPPESSPAPVDVEAILSGMEKNSAQKLNWRTSIVDLLKLLDLDSDLSARKNLARELHYDGSLEDSAAMNVWLQKQVMHKISENGGKVPADLLH
jgi:hypothetical protein